MSPFLKQCMVAVGISMNSLTLGGAVGYPAVLLPQLRESSMRLNAEQESWIASIISIAMFLGNLLTVPVMRRGRRLAHQVVSLLDIASWIAIALATSYEVLIVGRFIQGTAFGLFMAINGVILGEYTSPKYRGAFLATISLCQGAGVWLVHIIGSFISWQYTALLLSFLPLTSYVITIFLPESPSWLAVEGRYDECKYAFRWLRGCEEEEELNKMIQERQFVNRTKTGSTLETLRAFSKREVYISLILGSLMYATAVCCGALTLASYMNEILPVILSANCKMPEWMAYTNSIRTGTNAIGLFVIGRFPRRTMLFCSSALCVTAFLAQSCYIYAKTRGLINEKLWLGVVLLTFHGSTIGLGAMLVPTVIIGEIYPLQYRSLCSSVTNVFLVVCTFAVLKTFPSMKASIGLEGVYLVYAGVVALALVVPWVLLPETRGRTLQEIEHHLRGKPLVEVVGPRDNDKELKPLKDSEQNIFV